VLLFFILDTDSGIEGGVEGFGVFEDDEEDVLVGVLGVPPPDIRLSIVLGRRW